MNKLVKNFAIVSVLVGSVTLQSCNKNDSVSPDSATTTSTASAVTGGGTGSATTNVAVTQANLLPAITTYLTANYAGYTFVNAYSEATTGTTTIVNYDVNITLNSVAYHVVFDAAGVFVKVGKGGDKNGGGKGGPKGTPTTNVAVTQANLLPAITTYLTANYAGYTFVKAYSEATTGTTTIVNYDVDITLNSVAYHVVFDAAGVFVKVEKGGDKNGGGKGGPKGTPTTNVAVTQANLLPAITTYLTANYAGYTFVKAYSEATSGTTTIVNYDVDITLSSVAYHVVFDAAGKFVSVQKGK